MKLIYCMKCKTMRTASENGNICSCAATISNIDSQTKEIAVYGPCCVIVMSDGDFSKLKDRKMHEVKMMVVTEPHKGIRRKDDRVSALFSYDKDVRK